MRKYQRYKIAIWVLSFIIILQGIFIFIITRPKKIPKPKEEVPLAIKGKLAIVIDDWGYNLHNLPILEELKYPITASVLPNLNYSKTVAKELNKRGVQVILHLPMEPYEKFRLEKNTIMTSMNDRIIRDIIEQDLVNIYYAKGVSNHMGSKATEDLRTMSIVFDELKKRNLFFLDSLVSSKSICSDLANEVHLRFAKRDIFLDNKEEAEYIRGQIDELKTKAQVFGQAIGIGHDRKLTLEVLKEVMPELEKEGYKFVFVSELVK